MKNVIELKDTTQWYEANLLKASIKWMKERNDGRFDKAIYAEEELLRSFFTSIKAKGELPSLSSAA